MTYWHSFRTYLFRNRARCGSQNVLHQWLPAGLLAAALMMQSAYAQNHLGLVTVHEKQMTLHLNAFAQVEPTSTLPVNAAEAGVVTGLKIAPGTHVTAGQVLATLSGPNIQNLLLQDRANLNSANIQLSAARKSLTIQHDQLRTHLSTREMVHQAESAFAKTQASVKNAEAQLAAVEKMRTITAPSSGTVLTLNSRNGQLLQAGQLVVTLQSSQSLWLVATYYGNDLHAIHPGMIGRFTPSNGESDIPVRVATLFAAVTPGGGESVAFRAIGRHTTWMNGESGTVVLHATSRMLPVVPTRALILNQGKWWVMVHTAEGNHVQQVIPGPSEGWNTFIEHGISSGEQVVTTNAYLLFHSQITEHYQIPD